MNALAKSESVKADPAFKIKFGANIGFDLHWITGGCCKTGFLFQLLSFAGFLIETFSQGPQS